jgi:CHASE1-domain containing sensor protein
MIAMLCFALNLVASFFKSRSQLEAEKAARQQLIVLQRKVRGRGEFTNSDRLFFMKVSGAKTDRAEMAKVLKRLG